MSDFFSSIPAWICNALMISVTVSGSVIVAAFKVTRYLTKIEERMITRVDSLDLRIDAIQKTVTQIENDATYVRDKVFTLIGATGITK